MKNERQLTQVLSEYRPKVLSGASLSPVLPLIFQLQGNPYSLTWSHFMFEPMFKFVDMPRRMMLLCGRQVSKTLKIKGRGQVYLANGRPVEGHTLRVGDEVLSFNEETGTPVAGRVVNLHRASSKPCLRVTTRMGTVIDLATTHPLLTPSGYVSGAEFRPGQLLAAVRQGGAFTSGTDTPTQRTILTAYMIGDGCCGYSGELSFTSLKSEAHQHFKETLTEPYVVREKADTGAVQVHMGLKGQLSEWLREDGLWGCRSSSKFIPAWVFDLSREETVKFVQALWATKGSVQARKSSYNISYAAVSRQLAYQLKALLLKFGIVTSVHRREGEYSRCSDVYVLRCEGREAQESFLDTFSIPEKRASFPPENSGREGARGVVWDEVVSVEPIGNQDCWDIEVDTYHNYVLDGIVSHNSTSMAASQVLRAFMQPNYNILTVMPLYEQVRKFSTNYVRPFIVTSGIKERLIGDLLADSVLQRAIGRNSNLFYSYSSGDPNRVRGIPASECNFDEIQDLDHADLPIIESCMGASPYKVVRYTGTPKTFDNTAHLLWDTCSQAHWHIPCICGKVSRAAVDGDLLGMIGDGSKRKDGSVRTLVCPKCDRQLDARQGYYVHDFPERRATFPGYHAPQPILPMHYESPKDWEVLLETRREKPTYVFYNEVLGESYDSGAKLLTREQLVEASQVKPKKPDQIVRSEYVALTLGIDWGGRGKEKASDTDDFISNTAIAAAGLRSDGVIEIPWIYKVPYAVDMSEETKIAASTARTLKADYVGLDYGGQGNVQEHQLVASGWPRDRVVPFTYSIMSPSRPIVFYNPPKQRGVRSSYTLDKTRSILLLCEMIKRGLVLLPNSPDYLKDHLNDFLSIYEEAIEMPSGSPRRLIKRMSRRTDDVAHAINFAVMTILHATQAWPKIAEIFVEDPRVLRG